MKSVTEQLVDCIQAGLDGTDVKSMKGSKPMTVLFIRSHCSVILTVSSKVMNIIITISLPVT